MPTVVILPRNTITEIRMQVKKRSKTVPGLHVIFSWPSFFLFSLSVAYKYEAPSVLRLSEPCPHLWTETQRLWRIPANTFALAGGVFLGLLLANLNPAMPCLVPACALPLSLPKGPPPRLAALLSTFPSMQNFLLFCPHPRHPPLRSYCQSCCPSLLPNPTQPRFVAQLGVFPALKKE